MEAIIHRNQKEHSLHEQSIQKTRQSISRSAKEERGE
jgi:hypothetical protein